MEFSTSSHFLGKKAEKESKHTSATGSAAWEFKGASMRTQPEELAPLNPGWKSASAPLNSGSTAD
jgi:hypothetical protein